MVPIPTDPRWILEDEKRCNGANRLFNRLFPGEEAFCYSPLSDKTSCYMGRKTAREETFYE
jgi:hypothetical protein